MLMLCNLASHLLSETGKKLQSSCLVHCVSSLDPSLWFEEIMYSQFLVSVWLLKCPLAYCKSLGVIPDLKIYLPSSYLCSNKPHWNSRYLQTPAYQLLSPAIMLNLFVSYFSWTYSQSSEWSDIVNFPWLDKHTCIRTLVSRWFFHTAL